MRAGVLSIVAAVAAFGALGACGYPQPTQAPGDDARDAPRDGTQLDAASDAAPDAPSSVRIQDVQNDAMPIGTQVRITGAIVTAIDLYGAKTGDMWIEDPAGGAFSGVHVFGASTTGLVVGDVVTVDNAQKTEFALTSDTSGRSETELEPLMGGGPIVVIKTGNAVVPAPVAVDALAIQQLGEPAQSQEWEKWEGVLITTPNVRALSAPKAVGSGTDGTLQSFSVTGNALAESALAAFPSGIVNGTCLASNTGVVSYFVIFTILHRTTTDMVTGGTACP